MSNDEGCQPWSCPFNPNASGWSGTGEFWADKRRQHEAHVRPTPTPVEGEGT